MTQGRTTVSVIISAAIFILLEIAALAILRSSSTLQDIWINRASHQVRSALWGSGENIRYYFSLSEQNEQLAMENARLNETIRQYRLKERDAEEDANISEAADDHFTYLPATIVKMSRNTAHNYIILNKGSEDGVRPQSGIITDSGVIGIVTSVGKHYCYGLTMMNSNMSVGGRVGKSGVIAPVTWNGRSTNGAYAKDIAPHYEISPGDTVWTNGYSTIFPAGIPIGTTGGMKLIDGSTQQIEVTLFQDFSDVHFVTIVENKERREIEELSSEGGTGK